MNTPYSVVSHTSEKPKTASSHRKSHIDWGNQLIAYLFLIPAVLVFATFAWYPISQSIIMSFQSVSLTGPSTWVGLENYQLMLKDPVFEIAWKNTLQFLAWSLALGYFFPILIAVLVREMRQAQGFFRIVYFLPTVVPVAVAVIVWRFIYDPDAGYLNALLRLVGIERQTWLQDVALVKPSLVAIMTWSGFGGTALIYLASLQEFPTELYEAAELDGASPIQRILHITLPYLYPVMSLMFVLQIIAVAQVFTEPFLLTTGGPGRETLTPSMHIYNRAFLRLDMGYAAAWSVTMIVFLVGFSIIYRAIDANIKRNY
jgi:multiple sugar transport system permease protein